jgi:outer membrane lipoprotein-sorting protein
MKSKKLMLSGAVALTVGGSMLQFGGNAFAQNPTPTVPREQMSEVAFKNIQVLKGIPVDEFMGTMGLFSAALSVCCGDCHTGAGGSNPNWADDPPRKKIARKMIEMVNAINKTNFNGRENVTCWTCHRGVSDPAVTPALDTIYSEPVVPPPDVLKTATNGVPTLDQIFDKYIQALGGAANLAKITSYTAKGTSNVFGDEKTYPAEIFAKAPNQMALIVHQEGDMERVTNGRNAWVMLPLTVVKEYPLDGSALEGGKLDGEMAFPGNIKQYFRTWHVSFPIVLDLSTKDSEGKLLKSDRRDVYVVQGTGNPQGMFATFYFDKETGLLLRMIRYANTVVGRVPTQWDWSDYRTVAGVKMPFRFTYGWVSGREEYTLSEITPNVPVDEAKFNRPVPK